MNRQAKYAQTKGFIALSSILVIAAVVLAIGISVSLLSISNSQLALGLKKSHDDLYLVESCAEDTLLRLNNNNALPASITLPFGSCTVSQNSRVGRVWTFTVTGVSLTYPQSVQITVTRGRNPSISSWKNI